MAKSGRQILKSCQIRPFWTVNRGTFPSKSNLCAFSDPVKLNTVRLFDSTKCLIFFFIISWHTFSANTQYMHAAPYGPYLRFYHVYTSTPFKCHACNHNNDQNPFYWIIFVLLKVKDFCCSFLRNYLSHKLHSRVT